MNETAYPNIYTLMAPNHENLKSIPIQVFLEALAKLPTNFILLVNLGLALLAQKITVCAVNRVPTTPKQLLLKAIDSYPEFGLAYLELSEILSDGETIKLRNGRVMSQQQLYLHARPRIDLFNFEMRETAKSLSACL